MKIIEGRARAMTESQKSRLYNSIIWPIPVSNGSYLDVDEILARSLPRVASEKHPGVVSEKLSALAANILTPLSETQT